MLQNDLFVQYANQMADAAATVIKKYFRKPINIDDKQDSSPVTIADKESEAVIRQIIEKQFPNHGIIGEEYGSNREKADFVWVIDPIDGTKAFISGVPTFGTLIALLHQGKPILGIINQPISNERWLGVAEKPTTLNNMPIKTRKCPNISRATICTTGTEYFNADEQKAFNNLANQTKLLRYSADCYAYGLLALGFVDIVCEASLKLWDFMALLPIVEGSGGIITDWQGNALNQDYKRGQILAVGDKAILEPSLNLLKA